MTVSLEAVRWSPGQHMIVDGVSLEAKPGRMVGLIGPNGSGKSSLLRLICRVRRVTSGVISVGGETISEISRRRLAQRMALVEQEVSTESPVRVIDVVRLGRIPHRGSLVPWTAADDEAVQSAIGQVDLLDRVEQPWLTLSGGEKQRTQIARALAQSPHELLLDEPTNHLDIRHQLDLLRLVSGLSITVILAIHDLNLAARFCKELVLMHEGRVFAAGPPATVLTHAHIRSVFGVDALIEPSRVHGGIQIDYQ